MRLRAELDVLSKLKDTPGKNDKLKLLKGNSSDTRLADLLDATFNFKRKYFIKKIPQRSEIELLSLTNDKHGEFMQLLEDLETGQYRGGEGTNKVVSFLTTCTDDEFTWYRKVLLKDLKCGFSVKTAIKAGFKDIPLMEVMLAKDGSQCKKLEEIVKKGVWVSPKLDGYRCLAIIDNGTVTLLSRNGTEYYNFPSIVTSLKNCFPTGQHVFDGEIMSDDFQAMQKSAFANKRQTTVGDVKYHIFGYVPFDEWKAQKFKMKTGERMVILEKLCLNFDANLRLVNQNYTEDLKVIYSLQHMWEQIGYEGAMALPDIPYYVGKKSNKLLKFKTMLSQDCIVIGHYMGEKGTKLENKLGGFIVKQENNKECRVGSGYSDKDREDLLLNLEIWYNSCMEVKYQELTKDGIMRFPVFDRWRFDKNAL